MYTYSFCKATAVSVVVSNHSTRGGREREREEGRGGEGERRGGEEEGRRRAELRRLDWEEGVIFSKSQPIAPLRSNVGNRALASAASRARWVWDLEKITTDDLRRASEASEPVWCDFILLDYKVILSLNKRLHSINCGGLCPCCETEELTARGITWVAL